MFVIGGAQIYRQTIGLADKLYLTHVRAPLPDGGADVFFPTIDPLQWKKSCGGFPQGAKFPFPFSFRNIPAHPVAIAASNARSKAPELTREMIIPAVA